MLKETVYKYCRKDSLNVSEEVVTDDLQGSEIQQMQALPRARKEDFLYGRFLLKKL